mmetsp:Transcript_23867/g.61275  ORF Transcript_23867/g.61275 Transcript_23867/m.61275 type:complete len:223 (-) Transcript_23867:437-1105(-)
MAMAGLRSAPLPSAAPKTTYNTWMVLYILLSSSARLAAAFTAFMKAARRPPTSSWCTPAIVVPAGEHTASLSCPGCLPVSTTILAEPITVCAASCREISRGRPAATPPSASASMARNTYAGPLPLTAVTALNSFSSHSTQVPTEDISSITAAPSSAVAFAPRHIAAAVALTRQGVLGMTRMILALGPAADCIVPTVTPAAIETTTWLSVRNSAASFKTTETY